MVWGVESELLKTIEARVYNKGPIVELGSGDCSTPWLAARYKLISIEEDRQWIGKYSSEYIYAPLLNGWYDPSRLRDLPSHELLLIDGPKGTGNRMGILKHLKLFKAKIWVVHDTHRIKEHKLFEQLKIALQKKSMLFPQFGVLW